MALRDGLSAGRMLNGGSLDGSTRRIARNIPDQLERKTRHYTGSRTLGFRITSPAPYITYIYKASDSLSVGSMAGGYNVYIVGDYFDMPEVGVPFISPQGTGSNPSSIIVFSEQLIYCVWGSCPWFGQTDVYIYNHESNLATGTVRCFRYQPFEQVDATLFYRAPHYSVTSGGVGTWKSSERTGPLVNYYPATVASSAPTSTDGIPTFSLTTSPLVQSDPLSSWFGDGDHQVMAVVDFTAIAADSGNPWNNGAIFSDSNGYTMLSVRRMGSFGGYTYFADFMDYDSTFRIASVEFTSYVDAAGVGRVVLQGMKSGGTLWARVGSEAWVAGDACGTTAAGALTETLVIGTNYNGTVHLQAKIWALGLYNLVKDDATFSDLILAWSELAYPPTAVAILDLDSRFVTQGSGLVTVMLDQSGNGYDATAPGGFEPTYNASNSTYNGVASVDFPYNTDVYLDTTADIGTDIGNDPITMFMVGHVADTAQVSNAYFVMAQSGGQPLGIFSQGGGSWSPYAYAAAPYTDGNPNIKSITAVQFTGGDTSRFYQNSTLSINYSAGASYQGEDSVLDTRLQQVAPTAGFRIGNWQGDAAVYSPSGPILRVLIYRGVLSQTQLNTVLYDLATIYGFTIQDVATNTYGISGKYDAGNYDDAFVNAEAATIGSWKGLESVGHSFGYDWLTEVGLSIPTLTTINGLDCPQTNGTTDYMMESPTDYIHPVVGRRSINKVFASDGSAGTIVIAVHPLTAATFAPGSNVAQTPYDNPGLISDSAGYIGLHFSDAGFTAGLYDGTPRDSGGGPGTNNGWQMATTAAANATDHIAIMRWNGSVLEVSANAVAGVITWTTVDCSAFVYGLGTLRLGTNYSTAAGLNANFGAVRLYNTALTDDQLNVVGVEIQDLLGWSNGFLTNIDIFGDATIDGVSTTTADLLGTGDIASTIAGVSTTTANLVGDGAVASTINGAATVVATLDILATVNGVSTTAANLVGDGAIASTVNGVSTTTANLVGAGAIASTSAGVSTTTANLLATADAVGTINGVSTTTANVLGDGALISTVAGTATVVATLDLLATVNGASTTSANLTADGAIASTIAGASTTTASISGDIPAASTIAGVSTTTANLLASADAVSTVNGVSTTTADLLATGTMASTIAGVSTTIATFDLIATISGTATVTATLDIIATIDSVSTTSANLTASGELDSTIAGVNTTTAALDGLVFIEATADGVATSSADLFGDGALVSTIAGVSTIIATPDIFATTAGVSTTSANISAAGELDSTIASVSTTTADLFATADAVSTISGVSTTTANILGAGTLVSTSNGVSTTTASADLTGYLVVEIDGVSTTSADVVGDGAMSAQIDGTSTCELTTVEGEIVAIVNCTSTTSATISASGELDSTISSEATVTADIAGAGALVSTIAGVSTTAADLFGDGAVESTVSASSTTSADIRGLVDIASTVNGASTTSANLSATGDMAAISDGVSTTVSEAIGAGAIASTIAGTATISANLHGDVNITSTVAGVSTSSAQLDGNYLIFAQVDSASTTTATLSAFADISAQTDSSATTVADLTASGRLISTVASTSTVTSNLRGDSFVHAQVSGVSTTSALMKGQAAISAQTNGASTTRATTTLNSRISGTSTVSASITATGVITATVSNAATALGLLVGDGNMFALSDGIADSRAGMEDFDPNKLIIGATISGKAVLHAFIVNYLADKKISNVMQLTASGADLAVPIVPKLIHEVIIPPVIPPVTPPVNPAIMKSDDMIAVPANPVLIQKVVLPPAPTPEPETPKDLSIAKSGQSLGAPITPKKIIKSDNSIN